MIDGRFYPQHLATVENPEYPCVTFTYQDRPDSGFAQIVTGTLYIDVWSKRGQGELWRIYANHDYVTNLPSGIRSILSCTPEGGQKGFDFPESIVGLCREVYLNDNLYEKDTRTFHLAARYELKYAAKPIQTT